MPGSAVALPSGSSHCSDSHKSSESYSGPCGGGGGSWVSKWVLLSFQKERTFSFCGTIEYMVKQEMARLNIDILGINELKWTEMGKFNSDDHYIYYCGQKSLRRNGVALIINKRV